MINELKIEYNEKPLKETSFESGFLSENKPLNRRIICKILSSKIKAPIEFSDDHTREFDDILLADKKYPMEYKMDFLARFTGNLVFEILPFVNPSVFDFFVPLRCGPNEDAHKEIEKLIDGIKQHDKRKVKLSRHLTGTSSKYTFVYSIANKKTPKETKTLDDIFNAYVFNGEKLDKFVSETYRSHGFISTFTKGYSAKWYTISALYKISEIEAIASAKLK